MVFLTHSMIGLGIAGCVASRKYRKGTNIAILSAGLFGANAPDVSVVCNLLYDWSHGLEPFKEISKSEAFWYCVFSSIPIWLAFLYFTASIQPSKYQGSKAQCRWLVFAVFTFNGLIHCIADLHSHGGAENMFKVGKHYFWPFDRLGYANLRVAGNMTGNFEFESFWLLFPADLPGWIVIFLALMPAAFLHRSFLLSRVRALQSLWAPA